VLQAAAWIDSTFDALYIHVASRVRITASDLLASAPNDALSSIFADELDYEVDS
jgi:hypothetical protein